METKKKSKIKLTQLKDPRVVELIRKTDHYTLALWAIDCTKRVMPYFEDEFPEDERPRRALETLRNWMRTGTFRMAEIRKASLDSHAAAREVGEDNAAQSPARAAGQAVASAHVRMHSIGASIYALQAIYRATDSMEKMEKEQNWQYQHLLRLRKAAGINMEV
jgi:hypothetical protein